MYKCNKFIKGLEGLDKVKPRNEGFRWSRRDDRPWWRRGGDEPQWSRWVKGLRCSNGFRKPQQSLMVVRPGLWSWILGWAGQKTLVIQGKSHSNILSSLQYNMLSKNAETCIWERLKKMYRLEQKDDGKRVGREIFPARKNHRKTDRVCPSGMKAVNRATTRALNVSHWFIGIYSGECRRIILYFSLFLQGEFIWCPDSVV